MSSFGQLLDKKMDRARNIIDQVQDPEAFKALSAIYDVLDLVFTEVSQPQVVKVDPSLLKSLEGEAKKDPKAMMPVPPKGTSAGEKIAGQGGLYL